MSDSPDRSKKGVAAGLLGAAAAAYAAKKEHDYQDDKEKLGDDAHRSKKEIVAGVLGAAGLGYAAKKEVEHHKEEKQYEAQQSAKKSTGNKPQEGGYGAAAGGYGAAAGGYGATSSGGYGSAPQEEEEKQGMSTKAKVGLALGAVAGIGAAVAGGVAIKHHMDHKKEEQQQQQQQAQGYGQQTQQTQGYGATGAVAASASGDNRVRYGARIAIKHNMTGRLLSFANNVAPNSNSSGQKLVYAGDWNISDEDWWVVTGGNNGDCVQFGATIRIKHAATGCNLHSHNGHRAPCSGQQEVTCFSGSDNNDDWVVERWGGGGGEWLREEPSFSLRHVGTGCKLHSHEHKLPGGDLNEVSCFNAGGADENDRWRAFW